MVGSQGNCGPISVHCSVGTFSKSGCITPYSGAENPHKYGDFGAQRHWMEITLNMPVEEWYRNSTTNDLSYWGLDYPPLTRLPEFCPWSIRFFHPESVSLFTSRGHESYLGYVLYQTFFSIQLIFLLMRFSFLISLITGTCSLSFLVLPMLFQAENFSWGGQFYPLTHWCSFRQSSILFKYTTVVAHMARKLTYRGTLQLCYWAHVWS